MFRWYRSSLLLESDNNYLIESKGTLHTFIIRTVARCDLNSISRLEIILFPSCLKLKKDYLKGWDKRIKALDDVLPFPELHNINFGKKPWRHLCLATLRSQEKESKILFHRHVISEPKYKIYIQGTLRELQVRGLQQPGPRQCRGGAHRWVQYSTVQYSTVQ